MAKSKKQPSTAEALRVPPRARRPGDVRPARRSPASTAARRRARPRCTRSARSSPTSRSGCSPRGVSGGNRRVAAGAPGHGHLRQGRHRCGTRSALVDPQGVHIKSFKAPTRAELRHDFLWRVERELPDARDDRGLRPLALRGRADRRVRKLVPRREIDRALPARSTPSRSGWSTRAPWCVKCMLHISAEEQKERLLARLDDPTKLWKFNPGDIDERQLWAGLPGGLRGRAGEDQHRARALARRARATASGTATSPSPTILRETLTRWTRAGRARTSTSRSSAAGWRGDPPAERQSRDRDPHRLRDPLRRAAARGRLAARHRRGRRPRHLRLQVPRRRPGPQGARRRGGRRRAGPRARHPRPRTWSRVDLDAAIGKYEADEEVQDLLTASVGLNLGVDFLPGLVRVRRRLHGPTRTSPPRSCGSTRSPPTSTAAGATRTCWSGTATLWAIDHGAALYFHHAWSGGVGSPSGSPAQPFDAVRPRARRVPSRRARRRTRALAPLVTRELLDDVLAQVPDEWLEPVPGAATPARCARRTSSFLLRPGRAATRAWLPAEAPHERAGMRLPVRRAALRAARGPRGVRQRRRGALLPGGRRSSTPRCHVDRDRLRGARARASTSTRSAPRWPPSRRSAAATSRPVRRAGPRWAPASAS